MQGHYKHFDTPARLLGKYKAAATRAAHIARYCTAEYHTKRALTHMYCNWCKRCVGVRKQHTRHLDWRAAQFSDTPRRAAGYLKAKATRAARIAAECTPAAHAARALVHTYCGLCRRRVV